MAAARTPTGLPSVVSRPGYAYLHTAIDDRSRLAYTEELSDETSVTAAAFWSRAAAFFATHGIDRIAAVLTDNGSCYRGRTFNQALGDGGQAPLHPPVPAADQRKGERYQRILAREWAYQRSWTSNQERADTQQIPSSCTPRFI